MLIIGFVVVLTTVITVVIHLPKQQAHAAGTDDWSTYDGKNERLTLQNPTAAAESITVTLYNAEGHSFSEAFTVNAQSRSTVNITALVSQHLVVTGDSNRGYEVSMSVAANQPFVAERPMYWNAFGTQGGSTILGYTGG